MGMAESFQRGLTFRPRPDDVIIAPFGKCGTTWLQQIVHSLRSDGHCDYDDISRVVPWIETAAALGIDLEAEQIAWPRAFKSHLSWDLVPRGCRYLVTTRDPADAAVSMYHFMSGWFLEPGALTVDEFVSQRLAADRKRGLDYWTHLASWLRHRRDDDVLLLAYEDLQHDVAAAVRRIAEFCGIDVTPERLRLTLEHSSLDYMKRHRHQFDDRLMRELSVSRAGLPADSDSAKVRKGRVGDSREELSAAVRGTLDARWAETIGAEFGFEDYDAMRAALVDG